MTIKSNNEILKKFNSKSLKFVRIRVIRGHKIKYQNPEFRFGNFYIPAAFPAALVAGPMAGLASYSHGRPASR